MARFRSQRIRDPLHDLIEFQPDQFENMIWRVIQTRPFQRLRRVKQLGFSEMVYPGATHTRLNHSIGVFHIARMLMGNLRKILEHQHRFNSHRANVALAAALVHDVGHGPFSHAFEDVGKRLDISTMRHEANSAKLIADGEITAELKELGTGFANDVSQLIKADGPTDIYSAVVSSQFDADRLDYMRRDRLMTGTQHSEIDFTWLMANLEIGEVQYGVDGRKVGSQETLVLSEKSIQAVEAYVLGLFQLYVTVYFHKTTRSAEKVFTELMVRVFEVVSNGRASEAGLDDYHPLTKFIMDPNSIDLFLNLDDAVIWGALTQMADSSNNDVSQLALRLRDRRLWKSVDIERRIKLLLAGRATSENVQRIAAEAVLHLNERYGSNQGSLPLVILDQPSRNPYKRVDEGSSPLNQMFMRASDDLVDVSELSDVIRSLKKVQIYRAYLTSDDTELRHQVENTIDDIAKEEAKRGE